MSIRPLPRSGEPAQPPYFAQMRDVELALRADPPEVAVVQDLGAPAYTALRLKQLGLALERTLFVVYCHGTRLWITDVARKVRVLPGAHAVNVLEQASLALADVVVSPSAYLLDWMRGQGWSLPERARAIPYLTRRGALGEPAPEPPASVERVELLVFFGRLEERKGLLPFAAGLNAVDPRLLAGVELEFFGRAAKGWSPERVTALLSERTRESLGAIRFETELDQHEALERLRRPGTLAVMPSLEDNSPNTVYECLEHAIPFLASNGGGIGELVADEDKARVLLEPTAAGVAAAVGRALSSPDAMRPARPAFDGAESLRLWEEVVALHPAAAERSETHPRVDVLVVRRRSGQALERCLGALERQTHSDHRVLVAATRAGALAQAEADWVVFLDEEDEPDPQLLETLVRAQAASRTDVVSCAIRITGAEGTHLFAGDPGGLGVLANGYGTTALIRRSLLSEIEPPEPAGDPDWLLLAGLSAAGARVVSVPTPLVTRSARPGTIDEHPDDALHVLRLVERSLPGPHRLLARLAAGLAAEAATPPSPGTNGLARRAQHILRSEGAAGLTRRAFRRIAGGRS